MKSLLNKELKLATSPLAWFFLLASVLTMVPGYPILLGCFFVCLGQFQSFQAAREANDTLYTALLPVRKADVVAAKYLSVCFFELLAFVLMAVFTLIRMTALASAPVYVQNALMNPNPVFLAFALLIFALFNLIFVGGFFRTAYNAGKPFIAFLIVAMLVIVAAEVLIHLPGLEFLRTPGGERMGLQGAVLACGAAVYAVVTLLSERTSERRFARIDL